MNENKVFKALSSFSNADEVEIVTDVLGMPGSWCEQALFVHTILEDTFSFYGHSEIDSLNHDVLRKIKLGDGQFSLMALALLCKDRKSFYKTTEEDLQEVFNYFSYLFQSEIETSFNTPFLKRVSKIYNNNCGGDSALKGVFITKLHHLLCNKKNPIRVALEKDNGVGVSFDIFKNYAEEKLQEIEKKCRSKSTRFLSELKKSEHIKEIYASLIHSEGYIKSKNILAISHGIFDENVQTKACVLNNYDVLPRKDILSELIFALPEQNHPEFKKLKVQIKVEEGLSPPKKRMKPHVRF